jgi:hypothetical protein
MTLIFWIKKMLKKEKDASLVAGKESDMEVKAEKVNYAHVS